MPSPQDQLLHPEKFALQAQFNWFENSNNYFLFAFGFTVGALPEFAQYTSNTCVKELAPLFSDSLEIYIIDDYIKQRKAAGKSVHWTKYLVLSAYIARIVIQIPIAEKECRYIWPYVLEFLNYFDIFGIIDENEAVRMASYGEKQLQQAMKLQSFVDIWNTGIEILEFTLQGAGWLELWSDIIMIQTYYEEEDWMMMGLFTGTTTIRFPIRAVDQYNFLAQIFGWPEVDIEDYL